MPLEAVTFHQYSAEKNSWKAIDAGYLDTADALPSDVCMLSWNLSCSYQYPATRMGCIIDFIKRYACQTQIIFFQDVDTRAHNILLSDEYIRENFKMSPVDDKRFERPAASTWGYGNVVLARKEFTHLNCLHLRYENTARGCHAVMLDFKHPLGNYARFIGTELEYGANDEDKAKRVAQFVALAELSNDPTLQSTTIFSNTAPEDADGPEGFTDVFVNVGGVPERAPTWGMMEEPPVDGERRSKVWVKGSIGTENPNNYAVFGRHATVHIDEIDDDVKLSRNLAVVVKLHLG